MSSRRDKAIPDTAQTVAVLSQTLDQSEKVQDKVEQAADRLSSVNATLKDEIAVGVLPLAKVERVLDESEQIEIKVQEAANELVAVNVALAEEIDQRQELEHRLSKSDAALSKSRSEERKSRHGALHDAITGLANLTLFTDRLHHALAQAQRHAWRFAVMFIDLDQFKSVNDTHGHDMGDQLLRVVADRLMATVRGGDTVSRRSGDEFLVLMLEAQDDSSVRMLASRILAKFAEVVDIDGTKLTLQASIGIAFYPTDGHSVEELLKHADVAMYAAKQNNKGPVFFREVPEGR